MPIINGKKRYKKEEIPEEPLEKKRYKKEEIPEEPLEKKRYKKEEIPEEPLGKKRYKKEEIPEEPLEKKRYKKGEISEKPTEKKRYKKEKEENVAKSPIKRYEKGKGPSVNSAIDREATRKFISGFEFEVYIDLIQVNFSKIVDIGSQIETEMFVDGGNNDYPIVRQKARQNPDVIVFEKGMTKTFGGSIFAILRQGMKLTNILIFVKYQGNIVKVYSIDEGLIISKKFTDLDANSSTIFIEKLELAHTGISEIPFQ